MKTLPTLPPVNRSAHRPPPVTDPSIRPHSAPGRPLRVLVVDNYYDTADNFKMLLELWGYEAVAAYDGESAVASATAYESDVILVDIGLPKMDGCDVAKRLRNQQGIPSALLVALTAYAGESHRRHILEAGFDLFLAKPVNPEAIHDLLERLGRSLPGNASSAARLSEPR